MNKEGLVVGGLALGGILVFALTRKGEAAPPPEGWCCPYNTAHGCFTTYDELVQHVQTVHPGERIPLPIDWE
jgi:hypothetical protein